MCKSVVRIACTKDKSELPTTHSGPMRTSWFAEKQQWYPNYCADGIAMPMWAATTPAMCSEDTPQYPTLTANLIQRPTKCPAEVHDLFSFQTCMSSSERYSIHTHRRVAQVSTHSNTIHTQHVHPWAVIIWIRHQACPMFWCLKSSQPMIRGIQAYLTTHIPNNKILGW